MTAGGRGVRWWCGVAAVVIAAACPKTEAPASDVIDKPNAASMTTRWLFLAGQRVAQTLETVTPSPYTLVRRSTLDGSPDDSSVITATLDPRGLVTEASYRRRGPRGDRDLTLRAGKLVAGGRSRALSGRPVLLLEALCHVQITGRVDVELIDLATGEALLGRLVVEDGRRRAEDTFGGVIASCEADGRRIGPGAFVELDEGGVLPGTANAEVAPPAPGSPRDGLALLLGGRGVPAGALAVVGPGQRVAGDGPLPPNVPFPSLQRAVVLDKRAEDTTPPTAADRAPGLFLESDDPRVIAFAGRHVPPAVGKARSAVADALALAEAIGRELDTSGGGGPPSALGALDRKAGDCDDATALLVASLRALGHAARPVVGYRAARGRWVPHAWAEVYDGERWAPCDAMVPGVGPFSTHLRLFEGLGSPLTLGRTLGALEIVPAAN
jgi:hypothetical protein